MQSGFRVRQKQGRSRCLKPKESGQTMAEYIVMCFALIVALWIIPIADGKAAIPFFIDTVRDYYDNFVFALSLP